MPTIKKTEAFYRTICLAESGQVRKVNEATRIITNAIREEKGDNIYCSEITVSRQGKKFFIVNE